MSSLLEWLADAFQWLAEYLLWIPKKLWELIVDGVVLVLEAIPVPTWLENAPTALSGIPPEVMFFGEAFLLEEGMTIIFAAAAIRFTIRRIPIIG